MVEEHGLEDKSRETCKGRRGLDATYFMERGNGNVLTVLALFLMLYSRKVHVSKAFVCGFFER